MKRRASRARADSNDEDVNAHGIDHIDRVAARIRDRVRHFNNNNDWSDEDDEADNDLSPLSSYEEEEARRYGRRDAPSLRARAPLGLGIGQTSFEVPSIRDRPLVPRYDGGLVSRDKETGEERLLDDPLVGPRWTKEIKQRNDEFDKRNDIKFLTFLAGQLGNMAVTELYDEGDVNSLRMTEDALKRKQSKLLENYFINITDIQKVIDKEEAYLARLQTSEHAASPLLARLQQLGRLVHALTTVVDPHYTRFGAFGALRTLAADAIDMERIKHTNDGPTAIRILARALARSKRLFAGDYNGKLYEATQAAIRKLDDTQQNAQWLYELFLLLRDGSHFAETTWTLCGDDWSETDVRVLRDQDTSRTISRHTNIDVYATASGLVESTSKVFRSAHRALSVALKSNDAASAWIHADDKEAEREKRLEALHTWLNDVLGEHDGGGSDDDDDDGGDGDGDSTVSDVTLPWTLTMMLFFPDLASLETEVREANEIAARIEERRQIVRHTLVTDHAIHTATEQRRGRPANGFIETLDDLRHNHLHTIGYNNPALLKQLLPDADLLQPEPNAIAYFVDAIVTQRNDIDQLLLGLSVERNHHTAFIEFVITIDAAASDGTVRLQKAIKGIHTWSPTFPLNEIQRKAEEATADYAIISSKSKDDDTLRLEVEQIVATCYRFCDDVTTHAILTKRLREGGRGATELLLALMKDEDVRVCRAIRRDGVQRPFEDGASEHAVYAVANGLYRVQQHYLPVTMAATSLTFDRTVLPNGLPPPDLGHDNFFTEQSLGIRLSAVDRDNLSSVFAKFDIAQNFFDFDGNDANSEEYRRGVEEIFSPIIRQWNTPSPWRNEARASDDPGDNRPFVNAQITGLVFGRAQSQRRRRRRPRQRPVGGDDDADDDENDNDDDDNIDTRYATSDVFLHAPYEWARVRGAVLKHLRANHAVWSDDTQPLLSGTFQELRVLLGVYLPLSLSYTQNRQADLAEHLAAARERLLRLLAARDTLNGIDIVKALYIPTRSWENRSALTGYVRVSPWVVAAIQNAYATLRGTPGCRALHDVPVDVLQTQAARDVGLDVAFGRLVVAHILRARLDSPIQYTKNKQYGRDVVNMADAIRMLCEFTVQRRGETTEPFDGWVFHRVPPPPPTRMLLQNSSWSNAWNGDGSTSWN